MDRIGIVGCGNLGLALLNGLSEHFPEKQIIGSKRNIDSIRKFESKNVQITTDNALLIEHSEVIILALKPYVILPFIEENKELFNSDQILVSVATGVSIKDINNAMGRETKVVRAMPNTAASIGESCTLICGNLNDDSDISVSNQIFESLGEVITINEDLMESATIMGACGVAYVLRFMRAMIQGGVEVGFDSITATKIVSHTMKGAAEMIIRNGTHPEEEIDKVTTPKGCTIVGLNEMEHAGFSSSLIKGIVASYNRIAD